jgi:hypothetical protein
MTGPHFRLDGKGARCKYCRKPVEPHCNYCDWDCQVADARKMGAREHLPNGLPVKCIAARSGGSDANAMLLEHEHGDHPDYKFPVQAEWTGPDDEWTDDPRGKRETHALIYTDSFIAVTMHDAGYAMWLLRKGGVQVGGRDPHWRLTAASRDEVIAACRLVGPPFRLSLDIAEPPPGAAATLERSDG